MRTTFTLMLSMLGRKSGDGIIQLLTTESFNMVLYPLENNTIDQGDSRGKFWYLPVDITSYSMTQ